MTLANKCKISWSHWKTSQVDLYFLAGRKQQVVVNGVTSNVTDVISCVAHGTVLGPILFLIYISGDTINSLKKVYVDDTKVKKGIKSNEDVEDLQADPETLYTSLKTVQLSPPIFGHFLNKLVFCFFP